MHSYILTYIHTCVERGVPVDGPQPPAAVNVNEADMLSFASDILMMSNRTQVMEVPCTPHIHTYIHTYIHLFRIHSPEETPISVWTRFSVRTRNTSVYSHHSLRNPTRWI